MITCEEAVKRLLAYLDEALQGRDLGELEEHLESCLDCCDRLAFEKQLNSFLKERLHVKDDPPPDLTARIKRVLADQSS